MVSTSEESYQERNRCYWQNQAHLRGLAQKTKSGMAFIRVHYIDFWNQYNSFHKPRTLFQRYGDVESRVQKHILHIFKSLW